MVNNEAFVNQEVKVPKQRFYLTPLIFVLFFALLIVVAGVIFYFKKEIAIKNTEITTLNEELKTVQENLNNANKRLSCDGRWDETKGCIKNEITVLTPNGGEAFCLGKKNLIKWSGPPDMEAVSIWLSTVNSGSSNLGEFLAINSVEDEMGFGEIEWTGKNVIGQNLPTKDFYKIDIKTNYKGKVISDSSDSIFSLKTCK